MRVRRLGDLRWLPAVTGLCLTLLTALPATAGAPDSCITGQRPGATLLLPYFEVDLEDDAGRTTLFAVHNVSEDPVVAHAVVWTNRGLPTLTFDLYLGGNGVETLNLRQVLNGRLPMTGTGSATIPGYPGCTDPLTNPELDEVAVADLIAKHTGAPSPVDGQCYSVAMDGLATGYITVDAMNDCSQTIRLPQDDDYFEAGGKGLASNRNVLWGDFFLLDSAGDAAQGLAAVAVVAGEQFGGPETERQTFYRQHVSHNGSDQRAPLSSRLRTRYLLGGAFDGGTELLVWTEGAGPGGVPTACGELPIDFDVVFLLMNFRDQQGGLVADVIETDIPVRSFSVPVRDLVPTTPSFGTVDVKTEVVFIPPIMPPDFIPDPLQTWVISRLRAEGRFSVGTHGARLDDLCF